MWKGNECVTYSQVHMHHVRWKGNESVTYSQAHMHHVRLYDCSTLGSRLILDNFSVKLQNIFLVLNDVDSKLPLIFCLLFIHTLTHMYVLPLFFVTFAFLILSHE